MATRRTTPNREAPSPHQGRAAKRRSSPSTAAPHGLDATHEMLNQIRESARVYEHLTRADVRLQLHIESIKRRLANGKTKKQRMEAGHSACDTHGAGASPAAEEVGLPPVDIHEPYADPSSAANYTIGFLEAAREPLVNGKIDQGHNIEAHVKRLPIVKWIQGDPIAKGLGLLSAGRIIGACHTLTGNVLDAPNPAKVWRRMGLAVFNGQAARRIKGRTAADKKMAERIGYSPARRSLMHQVGELILRAQGPGKKVKRRTGHLYDLYTTRKAFELTKIQPGQLMGESKTTGQPVDLRLVVAHKRALRYIEKRLLREMWRAWNGEANGSATPRGASPRCAGDLLIADTLRPGVASTTPAT